MYHVYQLCQTEAYDGKVAVYVEKIATFHNECDAAEFRSAEETRFMTDGEGDIIEAGSIEIEVGG